MRTSPAWENEGVWDDGYFAWQHRSRGTPHYDVLLRKPSGSVVKVNRPGTNAGLGGIDGGTLVYQEWRQKGTPFSRIVVYDLETGKHTVPPGLNGPEWQYTPGIWKDWVVYGSLDRRGYRRLVALNRKTGKRVLLEKIYGYVQPAQVNAGLVSWVRWEPGWGRAAVRVYDLEERSWEYLSSRRWQWAPSVGPQGAVYVLETGRQCGSSPVIKRYARTDLGQFDNGTVLMRLPQGVDATWSYTYSDPEGHPMVLHQRFKCGTKWGSDVYEFSDAVTLTVAKDGSGSGRVVGDGIECGEDCAQTFGGGTYVTLTAEPDMTSRFAGWSRECEVQEDEDSCTFRVDETQTVTATFELGPL